MKFSALIFLLFSFTVRAFDKDFTTINDRVPLEFTLLFDSMKLEAKTPAERLRMVGLCKDLNDNLGFLKKEHIFMLMKTEVIKGVLEYKFDKVRLFDINSMLISRLDENYTGKKQYLNAFSRWIWQSLIAELKHRQKMGLINSESFTVARFEGSKRQDALRLQKYLNYIHPWVDKMDSLSAASFNDLSKEASWTILERLNSRSVLFKRYASTATSDTQTVIINIPQKLLDLHPEDIKKMQNDTTPQSLADQSKLEKVKAAEDVDKVTPQDMSPLSEDVARELENKTAPKEVPADL